MSGKKYYGYHGHAGHRRGAESSDGLFGWTVFIFLLIGFVFLCWMGSYYVFARPEKAANYRLLQRLHKLAPPQRFEITEAPRGEFLKPGDLLDRFGSMTESEIRRSNEALLRNFIRNYHQNEDLVPYAVGNYRVIGTLPLSDNTFCNSGVVALLQAVEQPEVLLEQLFTASEKNLPALQKALRPGQQIKLEKPLDLSAIVSIDRLSDNRIKLTTMPLLYGSYGSGKGPASFSLEPPTSLNLVAGLPVLSSTQVEQLSSGSPPPHEQNTEGNLTHIREELATPTPEPHIAKALPVDSGSAPAQSTNEPTVARAIPVNAPAVLPAIPVGTPLTTSATPTPSAPEIPAATPSEVAAATPAPVTMPQPLPTPVTPTATETAPSVSTTNPATTSVTNSLTATSTNLPSTNAVATPSSPWPVYAPGQMPRGELLEASDTQTLALHGLGTKRHYVGGRFLITASGNGKAVLRPQGVLAGLPIGPSSKIRVIVEFPVGEEPPPEGNTISRDSLRPFLITSVKRGDDGQINVYAREVTREE